MILTGFIIGGIWIAATVAFALAARFADSCRRVRTACGTYEHRHHRPAGAKANRVLLEFLPADEWHDMEERVLEDAPS